VGVPWVPLLMIRNTSKPSFEKPLLQHAGIAATPIPS
jgi:hypothetical protein